MSLGDEFRDSKGGERFLARALQPSATNQGDDRTEQACQRPRTESPGRKPATHRAPAAAAVSVAATAGPAHATGPAHAAGPTDAASVRREACLYRNLAPFACRVPAFLCPILSGITTDEEDVVDGTS